MGWRKWPYWLKGGIILDLIVIVIFLTYRFIWMTLFSDSFYILLLILPGIIISMLFIPPQCFDIMPGSTTSACTTSQILIVSSLIITNLIVWFSIGAIIGLIYGKTKNSTAKKNEKHL